MWHTDAVASGTAESQTWRRLRPRCHGCTPEYRGSTTPGDTAQNVPGSRVLVITPRRVSRPGVLAPGRHAARTRRTVSWGDGNTAHADSHPGCTLGPVRSLVGASVV